MSFQFDSNFLKNNYFGLLKPDTEENLLFYEKETAPNQDPIVYKYNNKGFRCEDFTTDRKGMHILFGGCSETEGAANLLEDVWAKVLYNKIKETHEVDGYYSVAKSGLTISTIIMNVLQYIDEYGLPDYIFLYFPDQFRHISWDQEKGFYPAYEVKDVDISNKDLKKLFNNIKVPEVVNINILYNNFLFKSLIQLCKVNNIKLFWSTWNEPSSRPIISGAEVFDGYVPTFPATKEYWNIRIEDLKARDGYHYGRGFHKVWAEKFYEAFINDKDNKKDTN